MIHLTACGAVMAIMADSTATTLAIPALRGDQLAAGLSLAELTWVSTANIAAVAALLSTAGRLADMLSRRSVLAVGVAVFGVGAAAVISAPTWPIMLAGRVTQGIGAALMFPASLGLLLAELPACRRRNAIAWWAASSGIGIMLLQAGGSPLVAAYGWRALYLPSCALAIVLLAVVPALPYSRGQQRQRPDVAGAVLLVVALGAAVVAISRGTVWQWTSPRTLACAALAVTALSGALAISWRHPAGAIDVRLWRRPAVRWSWYASALYGAATYTVLAIGPLYLSALGVTSAHLGWWLSPISLALIVSSPLAARAGRRIGLNALIHLGALALGGAFAMLLAANLHTTLFAATGTHLAAGLLLGVGFGALATSTSTIAALNVAVEQYGTVTATVIAARMLGGAVGVAASSALLDHAAADSPQVRYGRILLGGVLLSTLLGGAALLQLRRRAGRVLGLGDEPVLSPQDEVIVLRRLLAELREGFVQVHASAEQEIARLELAAARPGSGPPQPWWGRWMSPILEEDRHRAR